MDFPELAALAEFATGTQARNKPLHEMSVKEAVQHVKIVDSYKVPKENGEQALALQFGRRKLPLDVIKGAATKLVVPKDRVVQVTNLLQNAINNGVFNKVIIDAQQSMLDQKNKATNEPTEVTVDEKAAIADEYVEETETTPNVDGLDLGSI
tara:strand:- start:83 stop:538 length:456 start_codon:yes stop_codon:yes gene_type:complete